MAMSLLLAVLAASSYAAAASFHFSLRVIDEKSRAQDRTGHGSALCTAPLRGVAVRRVRIAARPAHTCAYLGSR